MREALLISYHFPPMGGSGVQRAAKLAKYLPCAGWRAHVICGVHRHYPLRDESLLDEVDSRFVSPVAGFEPAGIARRVGALLNDGVRAWAIEDRICWRIERLVQAARVPEREALWTPLAIRAARSLVKAAPIEAVVTTSPPHAVHLVGRHLKRRLGLPWIADLRDPMTDNFTLAGGSRMSCGYARWFENMVVREADRIVVTCPELGEQLADRHGPAVAARIVAIPNGYDPADRPARAARRDDRFVLVHAGSFYRQQSIEPILLAFRELWIRRPDVRGRIAFRVAGALSAAQRAFVRESDEGFLELAGYRSHSEAIGEMASANALLLTVPAVEGGRYCIPAKTFEYLAFGGHIIAWVHEGTSLAQALHDAGGCTRVEVPTPSGWGAAIEACFDQWRTGSLSRARNMAVVERFRRDRLAAKFADVIEACVGSGPRLTIDATVFGSVEAA